MAQIEVYLLMFLTLFVGHVESYTTCYTSGYTDTEYCQYDCCGPSGYQYCCSNSPVSVDSYCQACTVEAIVGIVIGSLAGLGLLIGIIACCCCCSRQSGSATNGLVLRSHTNPAFSLSSVPTTNGTTMPMTQLTPGMYAPSYPTFPQMAGSYLPGNAAMNYTYSATQSMNNPCAAPPPNYDNVANK